MSSSNHRISERRLAANRANALKSTGPRTAEGKARSSLNALRHGITGQVSIMTEEDRVAHDRFFHEIIDSLEPVGPLELQLASFISEDFWRLQRIRAVENDVFALGCFSDAADIDVAHPEIHTSLTRAQTFLDHSKEIERLTLYEQRINRSVEKNRQQLDELQARRRATERKEAFEARQSAKPSAAKAQPPNAQATENMTQPPRAGFVFSNEPRNSANGPATAESTHNAPSGSPSTSHLPVSALEPARISVPARTAKVE